MSEQTPTAVVEEAVPFHEWAKSRTFGTTTPATEENKAASAGADKTEDPAAPGELKADEAKPSVTEEIKAADPDDEKEDDDTTAEALKNPGAKKRLGGWARKAEKAAKEARELREENERLKAQVANKSAEAAPVKTDPAKPAPKVEAKPKPKPEDFTSVDDYTDALVDWKLDEKLAAKEQTQAERQKAVAETTRLVEVMKGWDAQIKAVAAEPEYADFSDVVLKGNVQYPEFLCQALYEDENGAKVAYQLAKDPALLADIKAMSPAKAIAKLGRLSAKFDAVETTPVIPATEPQKPKPQPSAAPKPIVPSSGPTQTSVKADEEISDTVWIQKRNQKKGWR